MLQCARYFHDATQTLFEMGHVRCLLFRCRSGPANKPVSSPLRHLQLVRVVKEFETHPRRRHLLLRFCAATSGLQQTSQTTMKTSSAGRPPSGSRPPQRGHAWEPEQYCVTLPTACNVRPVGHSERADRVDVHCSSGSDTAPEHVPIFGVDRHLSVSFSHVCRQGESSLVDLGLLSHHAFDVGRNRRGLLATNARPPIHVYPIRATEEDSRCDYTAWFLLALCSQRCNH